MTRETIVAIVRTSHADATTRTTSWHGLSKFVSSDTEFTTQHAAHLECANAMFIQEGSGSVYVGVHADCDQVVDDFEKSKALTSAQADLYVSKDLGLSFAKMCYPVDLTEDRFSVLQTSETDPLFLSIFFDQNFLNARGRLSVATLFVADSQYKSVFSLSSAQILAASGFPDIFQIYGATGNQTHTCCVKGHSLIACESLFTSS